MSLKNNFWKNKKVLITGHSGFKGSWLTLILEMLGAKIFGISLESKNINSHLFAALKLDKHCNSYNEDINDLEKIITTIKDIRPSYIVNFAALGMVAQSWETPGDWYQTNVVAQVKFHDQIRKLDFINKYVHVTTPEVYGSTDGWISECFNFDTPISRNFFCNSGIRFEPMNPL